MIDVDEIYGASQSLKAEDLRGHAVKVKISGYEVKDFQGKQKIVLKFEGKEKTFVANKTNANIIKAGFGKNPEGWLGKIIELYSDKTMYQAKLVDCIRVRLPVTTVDSSQVPF